MSLERMMLFLEKQATFLEKTCTFVEKCNLTYAAKRTSNSNPLCQNELNGK